MTFNSNNIMRKSFKQVVQVAFCIFLGYQQTNSQTVSMNHSLPAANPFAKPSTLPYQVADFSKIKDADYEPALEEGIKEQLQEIEQIANNKAIPSFANTLVALEKAGALLTRVNNAFNLVSGANTNPVLQNLQEAIAPKLTALQDAIFLNSKLFKRVEAIKKSASSKTLDVESKRLIEYYYQQFLKAGAKLSEEDKTALKKLNEEEASLGAKFSNQLLNAAKEGGLLISDSTELKGLSAAEMQSLANNAATKGFKDKWFISLKNTTQQPLLSSLSVRETRKKLFDASWTRCEKGDSNDTRNTIIKIATVRAAKAKLLGYKNYAAWNLQDQMAQTPEAVEAFFAQLIPSALAKAKTEAKDIQDLINTQNGGFELAPWDWDYYSDQVRKAKYNLDETEIKPYFQLDKVLEKGVFYAANKLYGLTLKNVTIYLYIKKMCVYLKSLIKIQNLLLSFIATITKGITKMEVHG